VWSGSAAGHIGRALAELAGLPVVDIVTRVFPDGEVCVDVEAAAASETVVVVQGTQPPQDRNLQELYQLVEVARHLGARRVACLVPYLAYGRQDRRCRPGQPISSAIVLHILGTLGATDLVTIDPHSAAQIATASVSVHAISAAPAVATWIGERGLPRPLLVAPDAGRRDHVARIAECCGAPVLTVEKTRDESGRLSYQDEVRADGYDAVVVDDLCTTGTTLVALGGRLLAGGARSLTFVVTHFFASGAEIRRQLGAPVTIAATDTVPNEAEAISVLPLLGEWIDSVC